jgi:hypothetical protein
MNMRHVPKDEIGAPVELPPMGRREFVAMLVIAAAGATKGVAAVATSSSDRAFESHTPVRAQAIAPIRELDHVA